MRSLTKKIELGANVAIIVVAILLGAVILRTLLSSRSGRREAAPPAIQPGTQLHLPGVDWNANGRTLILALSTRCHFCTESAPFYKRLAQERLNNPRLRLIALFPQSVEDGQNYLEQLGVKVDEVRQAQLESLGLTGTPTLVLVTNGGIVEDSLKGKLVSDDEERLLRRLK